MSSNVILYSMSRFVLGWFMTVASPCGIFSPLQTTGSIKSAIWLSFTESLLLVMFHHLHYCVFF